MNERRKVAFISHWNGVTAQMCALQHTAASYAEGQRSELCGLTSLLSEESALYFKVLEGEEIRVAGVVLPWDFFKLLLWLKLSFKKIWK